MIQVGQECEDRVGFLKPSRPPPCLGRSPSKRPSQEVSQPLPAECPRLGTPLIVHPNLMSPNIPLPLPVLFSKDGLGVPGGRVRGPGLSPILHTCEWMSLPSCLCSTRHL